MSYEFEPEIGDLVKKSYNRARKSNLAVLAVAGFIIGAAYDTARVANDLENGNFGKGLPGLVYPLTESALAVITARALQTPDGRRLFTFSNENLSAEQETELQENQALLLAEPELNPL